MEHNCDCCRKLAAVEAELRDSDATAWESVAKARHEALIRVEAQRDRAMELAGVHGERTDRLRHVARNEDIAALLDSLEATEDYCSGCPALGKYCKGAESAWIPGGLPDSAWPAYDAAIKALGGAA